MTNEEFAVIDEARNLAACIFPATNDDGSVFDIAERLKEALRRLDDSQKPKDRDPDDYYQPWGV